MAATPGRMERWSAGRSRTPGVVVMANGPKPAKLTLRPSTVPNRQLGRSSESTALELSVAAQGEWQLSNWEQWLEQEERDLLAAQQRAERYEQQRMKANGLSTGSRFLREV